MANVIVDDTIVEIGLHDDLWGDEGCHDGNECASDCLSDVWTLSTCFVSTVYNVVNVVNVIKISEYQK